MKVGDAARVAPIDELSFVFDSIFAVLFLGERLSLPNWLGIAVTRLEQCASHILREVNINGKGRTVREEYLWREWYAWFPVKLIGDGLFWLEAVWRRRDPQSGRWEYRAFRCGQEKDEEAARREI